MSLSDLPEAHHLLISHSFRHISITLVYGVVIGGSIALVLLVLSTVYKQDYVRRRHNRSITVGDHRPRLNSEKIEDVRVVERTADASQAGQGLAR